MPRPKPRDQTSRPPGSAPPACADALSCSFGRQFRIFPAEPQLVSDTEKHISSAPSPALATVDLQAAVDALEAKIDAAEERQLDLMAVQVAPRVKGLGPFPLSHNLSPTLSLSFPSAKPCQCGSGIGQAAEASACTCRQSRPWPSEYLTANTPRALLLRPDLLNWGPHTHSHVFLQKTPPMKALQMRAPLHSTAVSSRFAAGGHVRGSSGGAAATAGCADLQDCPHGGPPGAWIEFPLSGAAAIWGSLLVCMAQPMPHDQLMEDGARCCTSRLRYPLAGYPVAAVIRICMFAGALKQFPSLSCTQKRMEEALLARV